MQVAILKFLEHNGVANAKAQLRQNTEIIQEFTVTGRWEAELPLTFFAEESELGEACSRLLATRDVTSFSRWREVQNSDEEERPPKKGKGEKKGDKPKWKNKRKADEEE